MNVFYGLKLAFRTILRNKLFTSINFLGLVIGLFVVYSAIGYIQFELQYDKFHANSENIYRIGRTARSQDYSVVGFANWNETSAAEQKSQMLSIGNLKGVENAAQFIISDYAEFIDIPQKRIESRGLLMTNTPAAFTQMFDWQLLSGSFEDFKNGTSKAILCRSTAEDLLGGSDKWPGALGKFIEIAGESYTLAAIIEDVPAQSHFDFNVALNTERIDYWGSRIYVELTDKVNPEEFIALYNSNIDLINPKIRSDELYKAHIIQPITDIHLNSNWLYEMKPGGSLLYIYLIGFFGGFILLITVFTYANLFIAIKSKQTKGLGVQKALGANKVSLAFNMVIEGVLLAFLAIPVVMLLISLGIPFFNAFMGVDLESNLLVNPFMLLILLGLAIVVGLLSAVAPAIQLSGEKAIYLFQQKLNSQHHFSLRRYLLLSQFVILVVISGISYFVSSQLDFVQNKDLGFEKENILFTTTSIENITIFQEKLRAIPNVEKVGNGTAFGMTNFNQLTYSLDGVAGIFDDINQIYLDQAALEAYDLKIQPIESVSKPTRYFINRTAAEKFAKQKGIEVDKVIGSQIILEPEYVAENGEVGFSRTIDGIFEDINLFSLHDKVEPYFLTVSAEANIDGLSIIKYSGGVQEILKKIETTHSAFNEPYPMEVQFLNQRIAQLYEKDAQVNTLLQWFTIIAIGLAALGLIGISIFLVLTRTKEIGIRKVLGASVLEIVNIVTKEYYNLVALSILIGSPLAIWLVKKWLATFAYRIEINYLFFGMLGLTLVAIIGLLVGSVAFWAAQANPTKSLNSD